MTSTPGRTAVVVGGSSGIGLATAERFLADGAEHVVVVGRGEDELAEAVSRLGRRARGVACDIASPADLERLHQDLVSTVGTIDVLVCCAGYVEMQTPDQVTADSFERTFAVNAQGTFFTVQTLAPLITDGGAVVLVASVVHEMGLPQYAAYAASKAAVRSFARTWASQLAPRRVRVNAVSPGGVDTPAIDAQNPDPETARQVRREMADSALLSRIGRPEDIAGAVAFLASDDAAYITGADLPVDGGGSQV